MHAKVFAAFETICRRRFAGAGRCLLIHNFPGDFYRFSRQAMEQVLLEGLEEVEVMRVMVPPRLIGSGRMPNP